MWHKSAILAYILLICSYSTFASSVKQSVIIAPVYWQITETVDWVLENNMVANNQTITYKTAKFDFKPGFKFGYTYRNDYELNFLYTNYYSHASASATGNLVSTFFGGKAIQGNNFFSSGKMNFKINYNILEADIMKCFNLGGYLSLKPSIGIIGGWIYQDISTTFTGISNIAENVSNDFSGIGGKIGLNSQWVLTKNNQLSSYLLFNLNFGYLYGTWQIKDQVHDSNDSSLYINLGRRYAGAVMIEGLAGIGFSYKNFDIYFGYELIDWFDQYQVFDDGTGAHSNDLLLQGLTLQVKLYF